MKWRTVAIVVAVVLAAEAVFLVVSVLGRPPRGPASSSYATGHHGARGYARLLERGGHEVRRQRVPMDVERPDPTDTIVILEGERPDDQELAALTAFVRGGGRLVVAGGPDTDEWVSTFLGPVSRGGELLACRPLANVPETRGVTAVESTGLPGYLDTGIAAPILGCNGNVLAAVAALGNGRVVIVSDPAVFQNFLLPAKDNAVFAVNAVGGVRRDVVFLEHLHGFRAPSGLAALPGRWLLAVAVLLAAVLLAVVARRRLATAGSDGDATTDHPRAVHAEALAERLAAAPKAEAAGVARDTARREVAAAAGIPADVSSEEIQAAAVRLGLPADDVRRVFGPGPHDEAATVAAGRIIAACRGMRRQRT